MNEFFQNLKKEAHTTQLSQNEKQHMRVSLYDAMQVPQPPIPQRAPRVVRSPYLWFAPRLVMPLATFLVVVLGTGTAYAAQAALPGDILYPVKIHVNEAVEVALATTPAQKATTEEIIAERRVTEAQTLDAQGRLDATTTQELEDNFNEHASRALALTGENFVATTSATTTNAVHRGRGEHLAPRVTSFMSASTTPEATSSEAQASDSGVQNSEDAMSASLQTQKNILNELKLNVDKRGHGGDNGSDHGSSGGNNNDGNN